MTRVRAYFGPVTGARVIGTYKRVINPNRTTERSFHVADLLLRSRRGSAAIEIEFDNGGLFSERVTGVRELEPYRVPELSLEDRKQLASAYAKRGGTRAEEIALGDDGADARPPTAPPPVAESSVAARANHGSRGERSGCAVSSGPVTTSRGCSSAFGHSAQIEAPPPGWRRQAVRGLAVDRHLPGGAAPSPAALPR